MTEVVAAASSSADAASCDSSSSAHRHPPIHHVLALFELVEREIAIVVPRHPVDRCEESGEPRAEHVVVEPSGPLRGRERSQHSARKRPCGATDPSCCCPTRGVAIRRMLSAADDLLDSAVNPAKNPAIYKPVLLLTD